MPIIPKHYWETRDLTKTTVEPPLGSGPYRVLDFQVGRWIRWARVPDYWGKDLPVMRGRFNFDTLRYDYFSDDRVKTEAVKGDVIDFHVENVPSYWGERLHHPGVRGGRVQARVVAGEGSRGACGGRCSGTWISRAFRMCACAKRYGWFPISSG